ncbi:hypothetical protein BS47DRAFT_659210 [Hydnum rufescens UP504]|uniref:Uncharacterized protein n=1 Tax=Hydnum rufescens UP504 TaxID=1448309 RepID=A0A9P6B2S2_9AGAM|nr:hypothetical protein BS47DRAFT_659210 [Hydnum rufescens UP504]
MGLVPFSPVLPISKLINHRPENQPSLSEFATIISRCPELETLILNASGPFRVMEEFAASPPLIDMPSLRVLEISHQTSAQEVHGLVNVLRPFHLQSLTLADWGNSGDYGDVVAACGTLGFYHSVTILCIGGIEVSPVHPDPFRSEAFDNLFRGMPMVQYLTVVLHGMNPLSLARLSSPTSETPVVLPHLDTLNISGSHRGCVSSMVAKRKEVNAPIRRLILEKTDRLCSESDLKILSRVCGGARVR